MATPLRDATIRLRDGRSLAYREWGYEGGPVVLAFHGSPGSRVWWPGAEVTAAAGARLVTVDRPGYGGAESLPGRPIAGWAEDVVELADALGVDRFGVVGWSGGAPYAAAVAAEVLPDRLTGVCLASSASIAYAVGPSQADDEDLHISELIDRFGPAEATVRYAEKIQAWAESLRQDPGSLTNPDEFAAGDLWVLEQPEPRAGLFSSIRGGRSPGRHRGRHRLGQPAGTVGLLACRDRGACSHVARRTGQLGAACGLRACVSQPSPAPRSRSGPTPATSARPSTGTTCSRRPLTDLTGGIPQYCTLSTVSTIRTCGVPISAGAARFDCHSCPSATRHRSASARLSKSRSTAT